MHICHVNLASGYHGGENQTLQLIKQQLKEGYNITVVANPKSPFAEAIKKLGCELVLAKHFLLQHQKCITNKDSIIHVHEGRAIYWALIQHLLYKVPYIVTRRIDNPIKQKWLSNLAYSKASALVGLSKNIVSKIKTAYPTATTYCIPSSPVSYPTNSENIEGLKQQFSGKTLVVHAANMLKHKGFDVSISAARLLEKEHPEIHFALLGDGAERENLTELASGLSNVTMPGKQSNMGDWFAAASIQIHPSYSEGLGSVILEGINAGLPVVATDTGGIPDIVSNNQSGLLVPTGDARALADAIVKVATDDLLRARLISGGQDKIQSFNIAHTAQQYLNIYKDLAL